MAFSMQIKCIVVYFNPIDQIWVNFFPGIQNLNLFIIQKPNFHVWSLSKFGISLQGYNQSKYSKLKYSQRRKTSKKESKYRTNLCKTIENRRGFGNRYKNFA